MTMVLLVDDLLKLQAFNCVLPAPCALSNCATHHFVYSPQFLRRSGLGIEAINVSQDVVHVHRRLEYRVYAVL